MTKKPAVIYTKDYKYIIGIDSGTNTGLAIYERKEKKLVRVDTMKIHDAMLLIKSLVDIGESIFVRVEDARQAVHGRNNSFDRNKLQGAGSIKRDAVIWEDYLTDLKVPFQMVRPKKAVTKLTPDVFQRITGWTSRTSSHSRDAAMMVWGI